MIVLFCFIAIFSIFVYTSRKNYKKRSLELLTNLKDFNNEIKTFFYCMKEEEQQKFLCLLSPYFKANLLSILDDNFLYSNNMWTIQQQIIQQQELFSEMKNFNSK